MVWVTPTLALRQPSPSRNWISVMLHAASSEEPYTGMTVPDENSEVFEATIPRLCGGTSAGARST